MTDELLRWDQGPRLSVQDFVRSCLPPGPFRRILLKPNWVKHAESPEFPIEALVTSTEIIEEVLDGCLQKYPQAEWIRVGDVPLQSCDFHRLTEQAGLDRLQKKYGSRVQFLDLRRERWESQGGFLRLVNDIPGDPEGYREVVLDRQSLLEEISHRASTFRVSDYDPRETTSKHRQGDHRYLIAGSVLAADLVINLPKMKTHQKSGVTGALKNLVGINGSKAYLVHHQVGFPSRGETNFRKEPAVFSIGRPAYAKNCKRALRGFFAPPKWDGNSSKKSAVSRPWEAGRICRATFMLARGLGTGTTPFGEWSTI